jgi:hypothetical protein
MKLHVYIIAPEPISVATSSFSLISLCVYVYPRLSLPGNGSIYMFPRQRIHAAIEEMLDTSFSIRSVSYQRRVYGSLRVPPKRWSEGSQSRQTVKYSHDSRGTRNQDSLCWRGSAAIYWAALCIPLSLPGNGSVITFPRQRRIVRGDFYAVRVVSKESRRLVLRRTSCSSL